MSVTSERTVRGSTSADSRAPTPERPAPAAGRRSLATLLLGLVLMAGSIAAFRVVDRINSPEPRDLVLAQRDLPPGETLMQEDYLSVTVGGGSEIKGVDPEGARRLIGRVARQQVPAGSVLTEDMFADVTVVGEDNALVAVALPLGQTPPLRPGDPVLLVSQGSEARLNAYPATVRGVVSDGASDVLRTTVEVDLRDAPRIAVEGKDGRLAVVQLPPNTG